MNWSIILNFGVVHVYVRQKQMNLEKRSFEKTLYLCPPRNYLLSVISYMSGIQNSLNTFWISHTTKIKLEIKKYDQVRYRTTAKYSRTNGLKNVSRRQRKLLWKVVCVLCFLVRSRRTNFKLCNSFRIKIR